MDGMAPFMPHGMCFLWRLDVLSLHVVSDTLIALCYFCIPVVLLTFTRNRPMIRRLSWFFSAFILACGITHVMDVWTIWHADYWVSGAFKALAAIASLGTIGALLPLMPFARLLNRFGDLDRLNHELESQYRLIVENSNDGIWLTDSTGRTTFVNARVSTLLGYAGTEIVGQPLGAFLAVDGGGPTDAPFGPPTASAPFGTPATAPTAREWCFRRKDGTGLWAEISERRILDADGAVTGTITIVTDSTERYAAAALAESAREYRLVAEAMPHPVFVTDASGRPSYHNRAWFDYTGQSAEQSEHTDAWRALIHPHDAERATAGWMKALRTGDPLEQPLRMRRASDGMYRWFVSRATPVRDAAGAISGWIGSMADIHDFKVASETRSVLDRLGHIISIRSADGDFDYVSPGWAAFVGVNADEGLAHHGRDFVHPDDRSIVDELERASSASPTHVQQSQFRIRDADGVYHWFLARTVALPAAPGVPQRRLDALTDIDELKAAQAAIGYSEMRYRALTDAMPQMVWTIDDNDGVEYVNERWSIYTGLPIESGPGSKTINITHPEDVSTLVDRQAALRNGHASELELRLRRHDGAWRWHILRAVQLADPERPTAKWIVTATDIEARKFAEAAQASAAAELAHRAHHDPLTDLPNRTRLVERLAQMVAEGKKAGTGVAVLYLDLDHFKTVNDTLGHTAGDALLLQTSARINSVLRAEDVVSRFGGDEFVLACAFANAADATHIAERVQAAVHAPLELNGKRVVVSSSIGIALYPDHADDAAELILRADAAMYDAKESGRNAWILYNTNAHRPTVPAPEFESELLEAIEREEFVVHYQPIVDVVSGRLVGAEALVRWAHPQRGLLGPGEFIAFAENHGLIAPIGALVLQAACRQLGRIELQAHDDFSIAVNVSARQFTKPGFVASIAAAIESHGIEARRLEIEITESIVMSDIAAVRATLDSLERLGVKLSLDDFGTGYSSLAYLKNFPIHTLKIDRSFVTDVAHNFTDQAIAKTIVTLAHSLGMRVIAEGVETQEQSDHLRSFGADCIQGYLITKPLPAAEFEAFLAARGAIAP